MRWKQIFVRAVMPLAVMVLVACGGTADEQQPPSSPDGKTEDAIPAGKADQLFSRCEIDQALLWLNDPATSESTLTDAGIHARGAGNIIDHRNGSDDVYPSDDDQPFQTIQQVDDVYWVGPVGMEQLTSAAGENCSDDYRKSDVIFSPKSYQQSHLVRTVEAIEDAEDSIDIAMYSVYNDQVIEALGEAVERGVNIRMIYDKTEDERDEGDHTTSARLEDLGIDIRWVNRVMHHKFALIDGVRTNLREASEATLISGSGNWSYGAAAYYDENTVFLRGYPELALRFQKEFNLMWEYSREYRHNEDLSHGPSDAIKSNMILDRDGVHATFTSVNFRKYVSSRWGPTFGVKDSPPTVANRISSLMSKADESIWVASGHLRSRTIAETLMRLHRERPELDIRVYLDGQEFISKEYHQQQLDEIDQCLDEAEDEDDRQECRRSGHYFSYAVHEAGIPLRFKYYAYRWHYTYAKQMHHKYVVIDGDTVVSGSYNFSNNAEFNTLENIVTYRSETFPNLVSRFESNFRKIWETGRDGRLDRLKQRLNAATDSIPIVFEPMALTYGQITDLESLIEQTCPAVTSEDYDEDPRNHEECYL